MYNKCDIPQQPIEICELMKWLLNCSLNSHLKNVCGLDGVLRQLTYRKRQFAKFDKLKKV